MNRQHKSNIRALLIDLARMRLDFEGHISHCTSTGEHQRILEQLKTQQEELHCLYNARTAADFHQCLKRLVDRLRREYHSIQLNDGSPATMSTS